MIKNDFCNPEFLTQFIGNQIQNEYLNIDGVLIPNFLLNYQNRILPQNAMTFEFNHLIYKMFIYKRDEKITFYETPNFKIEANDIVFDCGANMGIFSAAAANKGKKVYSFEPMSLIRKNLFEVQKLYSNITVIPYGIWNDCIDKVIIQRDNPGSSGIFTNQYNINLYKERCPMTTIDNFINQTNIEPSFLKIDIEGAEIQLLEGAQQCINEISPKISIALHYNDEDTLKYIQSLLPNYHIEIFPQGHWGLVLLGDKK